MKKRGQVTIFIIIGIILLFSSALIFYIRNQIATIQQPEMEEAIVDLPLQSDPVQTFMRDCLESVSIEQLRVLGMQGGYSDFDDFEYDRVNPTRSSLLKMSPGSEVYVPYWYNMPSKDDCTDDCIVETKVPPLRKSDGRNSIEEHMQELIMLHLELCLDDFTVFAQQGFQIEKLAEPSVEVSVAHEDIAIKLNYPMDISKQGDSTRYDEFYVRIPLNLNKIYELAVTVLQRTVEMQTFEQQALNLVEAYGGLADGGLPPTYEMRFGAGDMVTWTKSEVRSQIQQIIMQHTPMMRMMGTRSYYRHSMSDLMMQGFQDKMIIFQNTSYPWYNVDFSYIAWWPMYVDVKPSRGELIMPDMSMGGGIASLIPGFGMNEYKFFYDISYPVLVQIEHPEALFGKGFTLSYVIESNLRNNRPVNGSVTSLSMGPMDTFLCYESLWNSGEYNITVVDGSTGDYLPDVLVSIDMGTEGCYLGKTDYPIAGYPNLLTQMPTGIGTLTVEHVDYGSKSKLIGVGVDSARDMTITLYPKKEVEVRVVKIPYSKFVTFNPLMNVVWSINRSNHAGPDSKDMIIAVFEQEGEEDPLTSTLIIEMGNSEPQTIQLVPGNFSISANIINDRSYTIPESEECYPSGWFGLGEDCSTIDAVTMDSVPYGRLEFEGDTAWEISIDDLYSNDYVTIYVPFVDYYSIPLEHREIEDLEAIGVIEDFSTILRQGLEPEWGVSP